MIKILLITTALAGFLVFYWEKVPKPIKTALEDAKTLSGEVIEKGSDMPDPVKKYMKKNLVPKINKFLE